MMETRESGNKYVEKHLLSPSVNAFLRVESDKPAGRINYILHCSVMALANSKTEKKPETAEISHRNIPLPFLY